MAFVLHALYCVTCGRTSDDVNEPGWRVSFAGGWKAACPDCPDPLPVPIVCLSFPPPDPLIQRYEDLWGVDN